MTRFWGMAKAQISLRISRGRWGSRWKGGYFLFSLVGRLGDWGFTIFDNCFWEGGR